MSLRVLNLDLDEFPPEETACLRCGRGAPMRFAGPCPACVTELRAKFRGEARAVETADYEPKMNVTPNAVALKDD
ncbi:MAG TPA: hypothetical protein VN636_02610 [Acidimicrobiia bacterium]|nr:hypothetical protein [Acidimicrobiia bacterium]